MKKALLILTVLTLTIGGCARPMNGRSPREVRREERLRRQQEMERHDRDRRPNPY